MESYFCSSCGRETGHKRALGWGTFFAVILTAGLWLLAIPFYPKRCIVCGTRQVKSFKWYKTWWGLLLILWAIIVTGIFFSLKTESPQKTQEKQIKEHEPNYLEDEKTALLNSCFGDFRKGKKEKLLGQMYLKVWEPHIQYSKTLPSVMQSNMLKGIMKLYIEYDEIWTWENDEGLTSAEKKRFKGQNDIYRLFWKQNKVQACIIKKYYVGNPFTGQKLSKPSHKIWNIYDRDYILKNLSEK